MSTSVGVREGGEIDGQLIAPLRPDVPTLSPGSKYLLETVIRTLKMGHLFTQGTTDSNEVWLDVTVYVGRSSDRHAAGRSIRAEGTRSIRGRISSTCSCWTRTATASDRRNAQDIFTPLYNHQIPPGAGQTVHYELHASRRRRTNR